MSNYIYLCLFQIVLLTLVKNSHKEKERERVSNFIIYNISPFVLLLREGPTPETCNKIDTPDPKVMSLYEFEIEEEKRQIELHSRYIFFSRYSCGIDIYLFQIAAEIICKREKEREGEESETHTHTQRKAEDVIILHILFYYRVSLLYLDLSAGSDLANGISRSINLSPCSRFASRVGGREIARWRYGTALPRGNWK